MTSAPSIERWLVSKAKDADSKYAAESWVLVAKTLTSSGSGSFEIHTATYQIHCAKENVTDAARSLEKLYVRYSSDQRFWDEIQSLVDAFYEQIDNNLNRFRKAVFKSLLTDMQLCLLLELAAKSKEKYKKMLSYLLALRMFPDKTSTFGIDFVDNLQQLSKLEKDTDSTNIYDLYLTCEVGPALFRCAKLPIGEDLCVNLLQKMLNLILSFEHFGFPETSQITDSVLLEKIDILCSEKWDFISEMICLVGERLKWNNVQLIKALSVENVKNLLNKIFDKKSNEWSFLSLVVIAWCAITYKDTYNNGSSRSLVLVPLHVSSSSNQHLSSDHVPMKKRKFDQSGAERKAAIICNDTDCNSIQALLGLGSQTLNSTQRQKIDEHLPEHQFPTVHQFIIDCYIYDSLYSDAVEKLENNEQKTSNPLILCQLASCYFSSKRADKAIECAIDSLSLIEEGVTHEALNAANHYTLLHQSNVLAYCSRLVMFCLQKKLLRHNADDTVLGNILIILQLDWLWSKQLYSSVCEQIINKGSLIYPNLIKHIANLEILEQLSFLSLQPDKVNLSIAEGDARRVGLSTRHSTRGVKDEIKTSLESQLSVAQETNGTEECVCKFLTQHKTELLKCLEDVHL